jgi:type I restriction enzyme, R subunit
LTHLDTPEKLARQQIDADLREAGWDVQSRTEINLQAGRGVAVREFPLKTGHGYADYLLYVNNQAVGVIEAKKAGTTLTGVEVQAEKYAAGMPDALPAPFRPLPFLYQSTGVETRFTNRFDPDARSRRVSHFHKPGTLADWAQADPLWLPEVGGQPDPRSNIPSTLRTRLRAMPSIEEKGLWPAQLKAVRNLEASLAEDRPRALIQMATGSGKTYTAVTAAYRMVKFADARRVLFLVDRGNLGRQTLKEFQMYDTPDDGRKFTQIYNVQHLSSNKVDPVARVCISTIQRLYSILKGEAELDPELDERSTFEGLGALAGTPAPVGYNPALPPEYFDIIFIDECHRSIYSLWRQVLEYFDAHLIGLTATPAKQTFGFFHQNLVMEYNHAQAVADAVNVDFDVYRIQTKITSQGSRVEAGPLEVIGKRDRLTRELRWEQLDDDLSYQANELDRLVVAEDQIRTIITTFRDRLPVDIFPGRTEVPKTLIYAKDDSHADDIVKIVREEFGKGNDFCQKITYRTGTVRVVTKAVGADGEEKEKVEYKSSGLKAEHLLSSFRNSYNPRIVVTVDMIATGTDIKPLEIVMFMRSVQSRNFFEQMKGRGVRVISQTDIQAVTPDAKAKDHFVIVDCVGVTEHELSDTHPLEQKRTVSLEKLLEQVAFGNREADVLSTIAGRLARMDRQLDEAQREIVKEVSGGMTLRQLTQGLLDALDPDRQLEEARVANGLTGEVQPSSEQVATATKKLLDAAAAPIASNVPLRHRLVDLKKSLEQTIDATSKDEMLEAGYSQAATDRAKEIVQSWEQFIQDNKDEITALQVLYSQPHGKVQFKDIKQLAELIKAPPYAWTPDVLWAAYEKLDRDRVKGLGATRLLTDIVSLVRFALHQEDALVPYAAQVQERFARWLAQQESAGVTFTSEQREWLEAIRDHVAASMGIGMDDFEYAPFAQRGGAGKAYLVFGPRLQPLLNDLNKVLAA